MVHYMFWQKYKLYYANNLKASTRDMDIQDIALHSESN